MAVKFSSSALSRRIPNWVSLKANLSSISCAITFPPVSDPDQIQSISPQFEPKLQFLKKKLHSEELVSVLNSTPDLNSSVKLFKWASLQKRFIHTADTYRSIIFKLGMAGYLEEMEGFCRELVGEKFQGFDKSLLELIDSFVSNHRFSEALRVLYVMNSSGCKPSIKIFNSLMGALVDGKRGFKDVLFVYKEMVKSGIFPNIETLNYLLKALFESGRIDTAMDQYRRMDKKGCKPNVRTFEILISGLSCGSRVEESVIVLEEMFKSNCEADSSFYVRIIPIFCGLKNIDIVMRLLKMMRASSVAIDCVTYSAVIKCLCEYLHLDDAIILFEEMVYTGLSPNSQVYMDIINVFCKLNKLAEAENFLEKNAIDDPCCHNIILGAYCGHGDFTQAKVMFDKMLGSDVIDASSWNIFIQFLCAKSMIDKALEHMCRMVVSSFCPDSATFSALILGYCREGNVVNSLDLFSYIRSQGWVLDSISYAEFMECLCERGNVREAVDAFCYMSGKDCALQSRYFGMLIEEICDVNEAVKLLLLAFNCSTHPLGVTYNSILRGLLKSGQENHCLLILSKMIIMGCEFDAETYGIIIQHMSRTNRIRDCVSVFNAMMSEDLMPDSETLTRLLSCLAKYSQVHSVFDSMDKIASESAVLDSVMYNTLIHDLWKEGYKSQASRFLDLMLEKGWVPDASTHALLMGSVVGKSILGNQDSVSCILDEGLGRT